MTNVELTSQDAERFKIFMRHYEIINEMIERGVFNVKNGHAIIFFNHIGRIMEIELSTRWRSKTKNLTDNS